VGAPAATAAVSSSQSASSSDCPAAAATALAPSVPARLTRSRTAPLREAREGRNCSTEAGRAVAVGAKGARRGAGQGSGQLEWAWPYEEALLPSEGATQASPWRYRAPTLRASLPSRSHHDTRQPSSTACQSTQPPPPRPGTRRGSWCRSHLSLRHGSEVSTRRERCDAVTDRGRRRPEDARIRKRSRGSSGQGASPVSCGGKAAGPSAW
jgi:hypothetical protein